MLCIPYLILQRCIILRLNNINLYVGGIPFIPTECNVAIIAPIIRVISGFVINLSKFVEICRNLSKFVVNISVLHVIFLLSHSLGREINRTVI